MDIKTNLTQKQQGLSSNSQPIEIFDLSPIIGFMKVADLMEKIEL